MNGYPPYPPRPFAPVDDATGMLDMSPGALGFGMPDGQSLDDMVAQNDKANRRRSMPVYRQNQMPPDGQQDPRRLSMLNFGDGSNGTLDDFQFGLATDGSMDGMMRSATFPQGQPAQELQNERTGPSDLAINTQFANATSPFPAMQVSGSAYASPMHPSMSLDMDMASPYPNPMSISLEMNDPALSMMGADMNMFNGTQFASPLMGSPIAQDFVSPMPAPPPPPPEPPMTTMQPPDQFPSRSVSATSDVRPGISTRAGSQEQSTTRSNSRAQSEQQQPTPTSVQNQISPPSYPQQDQKPITQNNQQNNHDVPTDAFSRLKFPWTTPEGRNLHHLQSTSDVPTGGFPSTMHSNPHMNTSFKNAYSSTGFDMLGVLMRVATRPDPQIDIGSVDLSCAFVVCEANLDDMPIVYCSENFERLTGYSKHMILGRNCRFLQAPTGNVEPGLKRTYCDDESVLYMKKMLTERREAQISLINYRRGGQPFMNLLTMIPIAWEPGGETKFFVGFQVDLVEQPGSVTNKNSDGTFRINYQRGMSMPSYIFNDAIKPQPDFGQTISKDEVSTVLATYGSTSDSDVTRRIWDKILLENTDDVIHVLSLKGLFLYLSPSSNRVLEYDPSELVGTSISSVCHPSDIVPVTRELKEMGNGASVNVVFRIRRKESGYMWFEGHGSLHTEQGKGRKCIILVGRERPVYTLSQTIVRASGGIGDNELWSKMSTSGMFLFVSSNVRQLLDRQPEELVGTSIQALMRQESKQSFGRILELARTGRKAEVKHEMINRRGQVLQAFTTIYPGDATEGSKPTFIVGQTRLLKYSRNAHGQRPSMYASKDRASNESGTSILTSHSKASSGHPNTLSGHTGSDTPRTNASETHYHSTENQAATFSGHNALAIGHQDQSLASDDNVFDELKTTRSTSWQYELRQMEKRNRYLAEEVQSLLAAKKKRKRRKGAGHMQKDCANCHTRTTPEWRRGPSGNRDLCNSCGLRWAKQNGRVSPRTPSQQSDKSKKSASPRHNPATSPRALMENNTQGTAPLPNAQRDMRSPAQLNSDSHYAKVARMEASAMDGFGGGIPAKIEEGIEPD
ncbi:white collar [Lophiostoma macrostomum CBS 122681]|uniref:White collar n=1 Tax=Lophiostoma macrostomum CBS 122681 TaxID=1314788 RepID=A0A6A6TE13_9PLEO|nr:white collar [Lophiostoma macrostomum CBS 122681]